jgi:RNA polymerase sigma factor (sigma-70 family)
MMTDSNLLRTYAKLGTDEAFAEIVRRNIGAVYSAALRRVGGDDSLAKDVTQSAFIALARKASVAAGHPFPLGWLYAAVKNEAAHVVRSERRRRVREQLAATLMNNDTETSEQPEWASVAGVLDASIDDLTDVDRTAILMRFMDKRTFLEMGLELDIAEDAARMRVTRALERLRTFLRRRGISSSSAALAAAITENAVGGVPPGLTASVISGLSSSAWISAAGLGATLTALLLSPIAAIIAVAAMAVAGAIYEGGQVSVIESRLSSLRLAVQDARDALTAVHKGPAVSTRMPRSSTASGLPVHTAGSSSIADPKAAGRAFMARHPEVRQAFENWEDAQTESMYGALFGQLQMPADQIRHFEELMRRSSFAENLTDLGTIMLTNPTENSGADLQGKLQALLGTEGYQSYQAFASTVQGRQLAAGLASMLSETEAPLTSAQAQQMAAIFASAGLPYSASFDWGSVATQAQEVLSGPQLAQLDNLRLLRQSWQQAVKRSNQ